jgi:hypothetical protein
MRLNSLLQPTLVKLASLGCFYKQTPLDFLDNVLTGPENLQIAKRDIVPTIVRHWPLLRLCPEYGEYTCLGVNVSHVSLIVQLLLYTLIETIK